MQIQKEQIEEYLYNGNIITLEIDEVTLNIRLVKLEEEYKIALQNFGYFDLRTVDYITNRYNCTITIYENIPEGSYCEVINVLIHRYEEGLQ